MAVSSNNKVDKQVLYERSVQDAVFEVRFLTRIYNDLRGKPPKVLREDFCGSAAVCCEWVRKGKDRRAYGIDLHGSTLQWAKIHNLAPLGRDASRVKLVHGNVLDRQPFKADMVAAFNFSYFTFKQRPLMKRYVSGVHMGLAKDGVFVMDIYGGPDAQVVQEETTNHGDFTYIWDQAAYNPVNADLRCYIHFKLRNGKMIRRAFTYDWRLWSIPELTEILNEVGFQDIQVYWEGTDSDGDGNGVFRRTNRGDDSTSWIAYIIAAK